MRKNTNFFKLRVLILLLIFVSISKLNAQACFPAWNANTVYATPTSVSFNGRNYTSQWWTQNEQPGNPWGVWRDDGACTSCTLTPGAIGSAQTIPANSKVLGGGFCADFSTGVQKWTATYVEGSLK